MNHCAWGGNVRPPNPLKKNKKKREIETGHRETAHMTSKPALPPASPTESRGLRGEDLTAEDLRIMKACEEDLIWLMLRSLRPPERNKQLTVVQEIVETRGEIDKFRNWAKGWGKAETVAEVLHDFMWSVLRKHVMGVATAQFVWPQEGETSDLDDVASSTQTRAENTPRPDDWTDGGKSIRD